MRGKKAGNRAGCCRTADAGQKTEIVRSITAIHHEQTGALRYLVQVIFYHVAPDSHCVAGRAAPANQVWILIGQGDCYSRCFGPLISFFASKRLSLQLARALRRGCARALRFWCTDPKVVLSDILPLFLNFQFLYV
jgi:phenylpyruvate tautomerase PptA (4-oxalocrotonate tautomerase family)